ncbi:ANTH domain-containing protein [Suillus clintonianus]|uniref:ANTH domain-containing protein n=1 Tax=Suillus clintonianus TaxID=1904413 RepID=UPI001B8860B5|nr:ANTH domain-containing protein [Suillus clintonianus]KAG2141245.1 ANTH domain-containing protein [Suillus clintonianus]
MSSFDKTVKLACKPKAAPPKAKYLDPIIAATWSEDGAVHDVCKALVPRLREPNAIVVFKALIVLHTMIRNGATDNVLSHLSSSEILRLRNVSAGNWEGYNAPQNLQHYAIYLDSRIRAYRDLKHDAIRVQAESNRDMRVNNSIEEDMAYSSAPAQKSASTKSRAPQRSKTIMGRKLRVMTVDKGLLRETKTVQTMIDTLVECRFYLDDLEDELTITALRMLVKDLLILFQAGNEGVINVLEHYFEMSKIDAEQALSIYRHFCTQTERVVEYLGVAKKLQNILNVPIPTLKHAPVLLAGALQEYLNDPNFEQNRIEYRTNKEAADRSGRSRSGAPSSAPKASSSQAIPSTSTASTSAPLNGPSTQASNPAPKPEATQAMVDFFASVEEDQPTMFNPTSSSPTSNHFRQQPAPNPFVQRQVTGAFQGQPFGFPGQIQPQATAFSSQSFQSVQPNSFGQQPSSSQHQHRPFSTFLQPQATGFAMPQGAGFLQPQATGANPFRQSMMLLQGTGTPAFNFGSTNAFSPQSQPAGQTNPPFQLTSHPQPSQASFAQSSSGFAMQPPSTNTQFGQINGAHTSFDVPTRPASTPLTTFGAMQASSTSPPVAQPVKSHQTGSRNPFGVPTTPAPPVPKPPTLMELAMGIGSSNNIPPADFAPPQTQQPQQTGFYGPPGALGGESSISSVASSFAFGRKSEDSKFGPNGSGILNPQSASSTATALTASDSSFSSFSPLSTQPTGATITSSTPSMSPLGGQLKPQMTGFSGIKPFKPTSSFGASLLESLPPIPQSSPTTPSVTGTPSNISSTSAPNGATSAFGTGVSSIGQQPTGVGTFSSQPDTRPTPGVGLRPQATGGANPFRATMYAASSPNAGGGSGLPTMNSLPQFGGFNGSSSFGSNYGRGAFGYPGAQDPSQQPFQQQSGTASLI